MFLLFFFLVAETLGMESNETLERRGSIFFSANTDNVDSSAGDKFSTLEKTSKVVTPEKKFELPVISVSRHRTASETQQYAETEVRITKYVIRKNWFISFYKFVVFKVMQKYS